MAMMDSAGTEESVLAARDAYLAENGFALADYVADSVTVRVFGLDVTVPNNTDRKWAIPLHDLHHVATGYGTDLVGEGEIGAWELGAGCETPIVYALNIIATLLGLVIAPRRIWAAFRAGRESTALYRLPHEYGELLGLSVGALRARLHVPERGVARFPRKLHEGAPRNETTIGARV